MATNTYGDLCPGSWHVGMVLRNLSTQEVCIPPKTVIGNIQTAEKVPDLEIFSHTNEFPLKEQEEPSKAGQTNGPNPLEKEVTQLTPMSPQLELEVPTLEPDVLGMITLLGCAEWDPKDQWEA